MGKKFESFGKYILLEKLNVGGMAEVFLARASSVSGIAKFVAIKRILPQFAENPEFIDMFKDEAKIAINLNHSNIVSIHEFGIEKDQFFLVMDYVEGRNLRQILNKMKKNSAQFSIDQIVYVIKEVAAGLDHAHRCLDGTTGKPLNITHRDMSPQNVMVSFEGEVKIVDFGIAKAESQLETTRAGTLKGKFGYMSPEQAEGQTVDLRTDIFSLGIVLWELLANDRLFIANNEINTLRKIRDCQIPSLRKINPNIHAELERITQKALARDRNLRYQTAAALHRDLNRFLNRQYPDFSPHDFSVFIKTLFADEILNTRKRLIDYAKIPFQPSSSSSSSAADDDKTMVAESTMTSSFVSSSEEEAQNTFSDSSINFSNSNEAEQTESEPGLDVRSISNVTRPDTQTQTETKTHNAGIRHRKERHVLDEGALAGELSRKIKVNPSSPYALETEDQSPSSGPYYERSRVIRQHSRKKKSKGINAITLMAMVLFLFGGFSYAVKEYTQTMMPIIKATPFLNSYYEALGLKLRTPKDPHIDGREDIASKSPSHPENPSKAPNTGNRPDAHLDPLPEPEPFPEDPSYTEKSTSVMVSSSPSGAEVYINGRNTGLITPVVVDVPAQSPFSLTLKRSGYIEYSRNDLTAGDIGSKLTATLQKARVGYLDIDVKPPKDARIFINGEWLKGEHLPITRYAVPASTKLVIRAENPYTQAHDEETVVVPQERRMRVILELKGGKRRPSNKR